MCLWCEKEEQFPPISSVQHACFVSVCAVPLRVLGRCVLACECWSGMFKFDL